MVWQSSYRVAKGRRTILWHRLSEQRREEVGMKEKTTDPVEREWDDYLISKGTGCAGEH